MSSDDNKVNACQEFVGKFDFLKISLPTPSLSLYWQFTLLELSEFLICGPIVWHRITKKLVVCIENNIMISKYNTHKKNYVSCTYNRKPTFARHCINWEGLTKHVGSFF